MIKVLIVDDEKMIRDGIAISIDWNHLGIRQPEVAGDGLEAYEKALSCELDIIITDIRMPGMNGLQLIRKLKEGGHSTKFIVLSGYGEFEYAKQLMNDGVRHYLLKPTNVEEITAVLAEVLEELTQERKKENIHKRMEEELERMKAVAKTMEEGEGQVNVTEKDKRTNHSTTVRRMIELIRHHYAEEELSLQWIAKEKLYMNADYLGKLFHKETGKYFSQYVMHFRVERAIEYMKADEEMRNYELAGLTGFGANSQYFIKVFKRITGITPGEYERR